MEEGFGGLRSCDESVVPDLRWKRSGGYLFVDPTAVATGQYHCGKGARREYVLMCDEKEHIVLPLTPLFCL